MKNIKHIYIIISILFLTVSCEELIDTSPEDSISENDFFKTSNDIENYVKKYYAGFPRHGSVSLPLSEANSDNLIIATPNNVINGTRTPRTGNWRGEWSTIRSINILFDNIDIDNITGDLDSYRQFLGEAHFFRAWNYFRLLSAYGDVPIYTTELFPQGEELLAPRNPRTEVADFIISDLDNAINFLDPRGITGNTRLNKETALAFKARVALFEGTWQKYHSGTVFGTSGANPSTYFQQTVDAAQQLLGDFTLYSTGDPNTDYFKLFGLDNMNSVNEILFYRASNSGEQLGHELQFYTTRRTRGMSLTWSLITSYLDKAGVPYDFLGLAAGTKGNGFLTQIAADCDPRLSATVWIPGDVRVTASNTLFNKPFIDRATEELAATGFQVKKYANPDSPAAGADFGGLSETGYIYFRYGEVLLNYAEALYELNGTVAQAELDQLRTRVGMPSFTVIPQANYGTNLVDYGYSIDDALYAIRNERRVELALEGHRVNDYRRWAAHKLFQDKRPLGYPFDPTEFPGFTPSGLNSDGLIDEFINQVPSGFGFNEERDYLTSIPQDELTLNPNLTQNPGW